MKVIQRTRFKLNKFITDSIMLALVFDLRLWTFGLEIDILLQEITLSIGPFHFSIERWATRGLIWPGRDDDSA